MVRLIALIMFVRERSLSHQGLRTWSLLSLRVRVDRGMRLVQRPSQFPPERGGRLAVRVLAARFVIEIALTLDFAILKLVGPGAQLARATLRQRDQI